MLRQALRVWWVLVFCSLVSYGQVITGTISGTFKDSTGAVLPGATVVLLDQDTGVSRTTTADAVGHYSAPLLPVGHYQLTGSMQGFESEVRAGIDLAVGQNAVVDFQLAVGAVAQAVEVTGEAPLVDTTEATVSNVINNTSIQNLPLNGRDLSQLILLNPAVNYAPNNPDNAADNGWGKHYSIGGQRGEDNVFILDGSLIADFKRHIPAGPDGALMGVETTQEFQVLTNVPPAQYGRFLGGVFNAVSKSGTNQFHGDLFEFIRNSDMDARNFFDPVTGPPPFRRNDFGATLGGPIQKDKTFFFVAFEAMRETNVLTTTDVVPTAAARAGDLPTGTVTVSPLIAPYLSLFPLPTPGAPVFASSGTADFIFPNDHTYEDNFGQMRIDHQFSDKDSIFARYTASNSGENFLLYPGGSQDPAGMNQQSSVGSDFLTIGETHIFSPTMLNTAHFNFDRVLPVDTGAYPVEPAQFVSNPGQTDPPELSPGSGVTSEAGEDSFIIENTNRFNFSDDVNKTIGAHQLQFGGMVERMQLNGEETDRQMGVWSFTDLANFLEADPSTYRGSPPGYLGESFSRHMRQDFFALYMQDNWRVTSRLTLNLGVRWEPYTVPTASDGLIANLRYVTDTQGSVGSPYWLNKSWNNIGPRLGFAWSPFASGKTSVRGGFGEMFEPDDPVEYYNQMDRQPPLAYDFNIPVPVGANFFPSGVEQIEASTNEGPGYSIPYANNKSPHVLQYNFSIQQQVGANNMFQVGYVGSRGIDELAEDDIDTPAAVFDGTSLAIPANATLVNPAWSAIDLFAADASSWYNGLILSFQRRFSHGFQAQVSYTWQSDLDQADTGAVAGGPTTGGGIKYANDFSVDKGRSGYDVPQVFTANYSWDIPSPAGMKGFWGHLLSGWQTTGLWTIESGQPLSVEGGVSAPLSALAVGEVFPNWAGCSQLVLGGPNDYFNQNCYTAAAGRELGNVGRNTLWGPGIIDWDPGLFKNTTLSERFQLQFRAELFNVLNRANFGNPKSTIFTSSGGPVGGSGTITATTTTSRQIQLALKLIW